MNGPPFHQLRSADVPSVVAALPGGNRKSTAAPAGSGRPQIRQIDAPGALGAWHQAHLAIRRSRGLALEGLLSSAGTSSFGDRVS